MAIAFDDLLTHCLVALGDSMGSTWSRTNVIWPWCVEAMQSFPILRPRFKDETIGGSKAYSFDLPADFRQIISVEYPVSQQPPVYLVRKNRLDPNFYSQDGSYDIDHNYTDGIGWILYLSGGAAAASHVYVQYLGNHETTDLEDNGTHFISIPDEYETILITAVMCRAYRQRLSAYMQDPTAHMTIITQMTEMVQHVEELYQTLVRDAQQQLTNSIVSPRQASDKFDRVY